MILKRVIVNKKSMNLNNELSKVSKKNSNTINVVLITIGSVVIIGIVLFVLYKRK